MKLVGEASVLIGEKDLPAHNAGRIWGVVWVDRRSNGQYEFFLLAEQLSPPFSAGADLRIKTRGGRICRWRWRGAFVWPVNLN
ncbi:hypothetical protein Nepgr_004891 [Nepenthes gracilis]|uniref:Uncharacterized protein n=1 Tax=Nepenthes gracilis TaxID=150966 RepID=A0AAD3S2C0_NEPGR|nr:hypothetical protein Nepgr_004891 [Nepenthes gracilis]